MKGWYIPTDSRRESGDSTPWYASFWDFSAAYLKERFGADWYLAPEQSLSMHAGNRTVPTVLHVRAPKGGNKLTQQPHGTSLMDGNGRIGRFLMNVMLASGGYPGRTSQ